MTSTRELLAAALDAAGHGWHVFPLRPGDKRPAFPDHTADRCTGRDPRCRTRHATWETRATIDPDRIRRAWALAPYNVGIACGPSGLLVLDLDMPKPDSGRPAPPWDTDEGIACGEDMAAALAADAGTPLAALYETRAVITGRGGRHLYYRQPAAGPLGNTEGSLGWLIDTRGRGGYVVGAGSVVAGRVYTVAYDRDPAEIPPWPLQQLVPTSAPQQAVARAPIPAQRCGTYLTAVLEREAEHVRSAAVGTRRKSLYLAALNLGRLVAGGALDAVVANNLLEGLAAEHVAQGAYTPSRARDAITSGLTAGAQRPRTVNA